MDPSPGRARLRGCGAARAAGPGGCPGPPALRLHSRGVGPEVAVRGPLAGAQTRVSAPPAPPLLLASRSPQRRAILEQLAIPFEVVVPSYEEHERLGSEPAAEVERRAQGKA